MGSPRGVLVPGRPAPPGSGRLGCFSQNNQPSPDPRGPYNGLPWMTRPRATGVPLSFRHVRDGSRGEKEYLLKKKKIERREPRTGAFPRTGQARRRCSGPAASQEGGRPPRPQRRDPRPRRTGAAPRLPASRSSRAAAPRPAPLGSPLRGAGEAPPRPVRGKEPARWLVAGRGEGLRCGARGCLGAPALPPGGTPDRARSCPGSPLPIFGFLRAVPEHLACASVALGSLCEDMQT